MPASVGPARLPSSGVSVWQATQARNTSRAMVAGIGRERIVRRAHRHGADRLAGHGVPAADHAVGAAGQQRAVVGKERHRPHRQAGADQRTRELARLALDDRDRAADAGGGHKRAVARYRERQ